MHIGVAVDTDRGLLVPVIRDVDKKGIIELSAELAKLSEKARAGKLTLDEMSGGVHHDHQPRRHRRRRLHADRQLAGGRDPRHLARQHGAGAGTDSEFQPRLMLPLSLSYDHRVIDGADAARFLRWVAEALEQPFLLAL